MNILPFNPPKFYVEIPIPRTVIILSAPTKQDYYRMTMSDSKGLLADEIMEKYSAGGVVPLTPDMKAGFIERYIEQIDTFRKVNMDYLEIPSKTDFSGKTAKTSKLTSLTYAEHAVYKYSGLDFIKQMDLSIIEYWLIMADCIKSELLKSDDGKDYLDECYNDMHQVSTIRG